MEDVNEINLTGSAVTSESGGGLTPVTAQEKILIESVVVNDSGLETTPSRVDGINLDESNLTQSVVISEAGAKSTPMATKTIEKEYSINDIFNFMRAMSDDIKQSVHCRFDSNDINMKEQNEKFDKLSNDFDIKFDELKIDINNVKNKCVSQCNEL